MWGQLGQLLRWPNFYAAIALVVGGKLAYSLYIGIWEHMLVDAIVLGLIGIMFVVMCRPFTPKTGTTDRQDGGHER